MSGQPVIRKLSAMLPMIALLLGASFVSAPGARASGAAILGAGSTWSQIAVDQWRADVASKYGLEINYSGIGSTAGRQFYIQNQVQFANSELPFLPPEVQQLHHEHKSYQYLPIVAGGTSAMYNLVIGGVRVSNLQLSYKSLAGIFTGAIRYWDDPVIKADNKTNGLADKLPHLAITPVVRSDGSGTSWQFSAYLDYKEPSAWRTFCNTYQISPCGQTQFWPTSSPFVGQNGSDGVANYVSAAAANGAIGYVEAGYALQRKFPVASILNKSGHYVQPTSLNDATALRQATFNSDRTQNLTGVYNSPESNAYPISSYSYMITPTRTDSVFSTADGYTLGRFILYFACAGQQEAAPLGYSPLPENLVLGDFAAVRAIPGAPSPPPISQCDNPTIPGHSQTGGNPQNNGGGTGPTATPSVGSSKHASQAGATPTPVASSAGSEAVSAVTGTALTVDQMDERQSAVLASVQGIKPEPLLPLTLAGVDVCLLVFIAPWFLHRRRLRRRGDTGLDGGRTGG
jgi:phosphate transport system substrate-binding protein